MMIVPGSAFLPMHEVTPGDNDPYWDDVVWLFHFNNDIIDATGNLTAAQTNTRFADDGPFGLGEKCLETNYAYANPSYVYKLSGAENGVIDIGTGDCTIELWVKIDIWLSVINHWLFENGTSTSGQLSYIKVDADYGYTVGAARINTTESLNEVWHWLVFQRESGVWTMWRDGVKEANTASDSMNIVSFATGRCGGTDPSMYIRIAEHRGTKRARYSGDTLMVPTAPFPNY